jgi:hypothetical protein
VAAQTGLGRYSAPVPPDAFERRDLLVVRVFTDADDGRTEVWRGPLSLPPAAETLLTGADVGRLDGIARASGGRLLPDDRAFRAAAEGARTSSTREVSAELAALSAALVCLELVARFALRRARRREGAPP